MKQVKLEFDKLITSLAGNRYGRDVYKNQVKGYISDDESVVAVIPKGIEDIASSFIAGFYAELSEQYGIERAHEMLVLETNDEYIKGKIDNVRSTYGV